MPTLPKILDLLLEAHYFFSIWPKPLFTFFIVKAYDLDEMPQSWHTKKYLIWKFEILFLKTKQKLSTYNFFAK